MVDFTLNNVVIKFYDSIKECPIENYNEFNAWLVTDLGIGSDIESVEKHFEMLDQFISANKMQEAGKERENLHYQFYYMLNKINCKSLSFCALVHSIDGEKNEDLTQNGLESVAKKLSKLGFTQAQVDEYFSDVKKKFSDDMKEYFPDMFNDSSSIDYISNLIKRSRLECDRIIEDKGERSEIVRLIQNVDSYLLDLQKPMDFSDNNILTKNMEVFEDLCNALENNGVKSPEKQTTYRYYSKLRYYKKLSQKQKK